MGPIIKQKVIIKKTKKKLFYYLSAAEDTYGCSEPRFNQWDLIEKPSHIPPIGDLPRTAVAGFALAWPPSCTKYLKKDLSNSTSRDIGPQRLTERL